MEHPFFADIDFDKLLNKDFPAPYTPILDGQADIRHFDTEITELPIESPGQSCSPLVTISPKGHKRDVEDEDDDFKGFSFEAKLIPSPPPRVLAFLN